MQTHLVPKIIHQNHAVIFLQFNSGKSSFIVLVPEVGADDVALKVAQVGECEVEEEREE